MTVAICRIRKKLAGSMTNLGVSESRSRRFQDCSVPQMQVVRHSRFPTGFSNKSHHLDARSIRSTVLHGPFDTRLQSFCRYAQSVAAASVPNVNSCLPPYPTWDQNASCQVHPTPQTKPRQTLESWKLSANSYQAAAPTRPLEGRSNGQVQSSSNDFHLAAAMH